MSQNTEFIFSALYMTDKLVIHVSIDKFIRMLLTSHTFYSSNVGVFLWFSFRGIIFIELNSSNCVCM